MRTSHLIAALALVAGTMTQAQAQTAQRFVIEREIPGASKMSPEQLRDAARQSNRVLKDMGKDIQWLQSYVAGDRIYCVYSASSEALIREHAQKSGFPANRITPVAAVIDPSTAQ
jgi:predicted deacylase